RQEAEALRIPRSPPMRIARRLLVPAFAVVGGALAFLPCGPTALASSHSEAPGTAADRAVDGTDVYAFVIPDAPTTVTLVANYFPLEEPAGGPNYFGFADD